jgi:hypothetical protein
MFLDSKWMRNLVPKELRLSIIYENNLLNHKGYHD